MQASKDRASTWLLKEQQGDGSVAAPSRGDGSLLGRAFLPTADLEDNISAKTHPGPPVAFALAGLNPREEYGFAVDVDQSSQGTDAAQEPAAVGQEADMRRGQRFKKVGEASWRLLCFSRRRTCYCVSGCLFMCGDLFIMRTSPLFTASTSSDYHI